MEIVLHFIGASLLESLLGQMRILELGKAVICLRSHGLAIKGELGLVLSPLPFVILTQPPSGGGGGGLCMAELMAGPASRSQLREWYPEKSLAMCNASLLQHFSSLEIPWLPPRPHC